MRLGSAKTSLSAVSAVLAAILCLAAGKPTRTGKLAKYVELCRFKDPQLNQCMTKTLKEIIVKYAKTGIPELKIPALEPFVIDELDLKMFQGLGASLFGGNVQRSDKYKAFARNLIVHHSSEFTLNDLKVNIEKREIYIDINFPKLQVEGEYDVNLVMFNLPIKSTGPVFVNATDIFVKATLNGKSLKKKDDTYLLFDSVDIKVDFKDYSVVIENLFKKDQNLNKALNDVIQNQKAELRKLTMPMIEELAGKMVLKMANQILSGLPINDIFLMD